MPLAPAQSQLLGALFNGSSSGHAGPGLPLPDLHAWSGAAATVRSEPSLVRRWLEGKCSAFAGDAHAHAALCGLLQRVEQCLACATDEAAAHEAVLQEMQHFISSSLCTGGGVAMGGQQLAAVAAALLGPCVGWGAGGWPLGAELEQLVGDWRQVYRFNGGHAGAGPLEALRQRRAQQQQQQQQLRGDALIHGALEHTEEQQLPMQRPGGTHFLDCWHSFINHSCKPNAMHQMLWLPSSSSSSSSSSDNGGGSSDTGGSGGKGGGSVPLSVVRATRDIAAGEQLSTCYLGVWSCATPRAHRRRLLRLNWRADCECDRCREEHQLLGGAASSATAHSAAVQSAWAVFERYQGYDCSLTGCMTDHPRQLVRELQRAQPRMVAAMASDLTPHCERLLALAAGTGRRRQQQQPGSKEAALMLAAAAAPLYCCYLATLEGLGVWDVRMLRAVLRVLAQAHPASLGSTGEVARELYIRAVQLQRVGDLPEAVAAGYVREGEAALRACLQSHYGSSLGPVVEQQLLEAAVRVPL